MANFNPYLTFAGNAEEAFEFYKYVFGGEFSNVNRFKDMPDAGNLSEIEKEKIMHIALPLGGGDVLMASDALDSMGANVIAGNNFSISINTDTEEEAAKFFDDLSAGGTIEIPLQKTFWGALFGMFTDKFGIKWMVNYDFKEVE